MPDRKPHTQKKQNTIVSNFDATGYGISDDRDETRGNTFGIYHVFLTVLAKKKTVNATITAVAVGNIIVNGRFI